MNKPKIKLPPISVKTVAKYGILLLSMLAMNCALPQKEPFSFALFYAALLCGFDPILSGASYVIASLTALSWLASLSAFIQAIILALATIVTARAQRQLGWERLIYLIVCQLPFVFLFPHNGYAAFDIPSIWQKTVLATLIVLLSVLFEGGLQALLQRVFRCKLTAGQLTELTLMWLFFGTGICTTLGDEIFFAISLAALLLSVQLLKNATAVPLAIVLSLPLCFARSTFMPLAEYAVFSCLALLFSPYGHIVSALTLLFSFPIAQFFEGLYNEPTQKIVFTLIAAIIPVILAIATPERIYKQAKNILMFYRERALPRIAINRNRRAIGERLYEVSSLFREIECVFSNDDERTDISEKLSEQLRATLCADCPGRRRCETSGAFASMEKLVHIGSIKGQVSLVDLPVDLGSICGNSAGLLFATNKVLAQYNSCVREQETAKESRKLLAEQAHGVSEILRDIAIEQSEEFVFSEGENVLSDALATAGILSSEIFIYGEGNSLTVNLTLANNVNGKRLCTVASTALGIPLTLKEKIPLTVNRSCFILRRKPIFDAAFGIATRCKEGESINGDTYSVLKIDERKFLVALSDGMGSGDAAHAVSDRTLTLLESFYKAKMPSETVLSTVNRLISYSNEEIFSCLDLAAVDLDTGDADIVKIGSPIGFILTSEELRVLQGESLPMGMLDAIHPATMQAHLNENDFMLFMSDGVTSAFGSSSELYSYLSTLRPLNPQSLAEEVLNTALTKYQSKAEDDMTVLAVKLLKTA